LYAQLSLIRRKEEILVFFAMILRGGISGFEKSYFEEKKNLEFLCLLRRKGAYVLPAATQG
jgi:hypothetical protein